MQKLLEESTKLRAGGRLNEALEAARQAVDLAEQRVPADAKLLADTLHAFGLNCFYAAKYADAEKTFVRVVEVRESPTGRRDEGELAQALVDLAQAFLAQGKYRQVEPLLRRSLELRLKTGEGDNHPDVVNALNNLGDYFTVGDYQQARSLFERTLSARQRLSGPDSLAAAQSLNNLGLVFQRLGDFSTRPRPTS